MDPCCQSCSILNNISVISPKFINKFMQKCQCYYTFSDQSIPLATVTSVVSLLTEQLCMSRSKILLYKNSILWFALALIKEWWNHYNFVLKIMNHKKNFVVLFNHGRHRKLFSLSKLKWRSNLSDTY